MMNDIGWKCRRIVGDVEWWSLPSSLPKQSKISAEKAMQVSDATGFRTRPILQISAETSQIVSSRFIHPLHHHRRSDRDPSSVPSNVRGVDGAMNDDEMLFWLVGRCLTLFWSHFSGLTSTTVTLSGRSMIRFWPLKFICIRTVHWCVPTVAALEAVISSWPSDFPVATLKFLGESPEIPRAS